MIRPPTHSAAVASPTFEDPCPMSATREKTTTMDPAMDVTSVTNDTASSTRTGAGDLSDQDRPVRHHNDDHEPDDRDEGEECESLDDDAGRGENHLGPVVVSTNPEPGERSVPELIVGAPESTDTTFNSPTAAPSFPPYLCVRHYPRELTQPVMLTKETGHTRPSGSRRVAAPRSCAVTRVRRRRCRSE